MTTLYGGIDIGLKDFQFQAMDRDGKTIGKSKRFSNNVPGMEQLVNYIDEQYHQHGFTSVSLGMEATGLYWFPLFHALQNHERVQAWDTQLLSLNPKIVESFRQAYSDVDKTDAVDALIIADRIRFGRGIAPQHIHNETFLALQRLTRFYVHLVEQKTNLKNYASSFLFLTFSEWSRLRPFSDRFGATACKLMKKYKSASAMAEITQEELQQLLVEFSRNHFRDPKQKSEDLLQMASDSFTVPHGLADSVHLLVKQTLQQLDLLDKHIERLTRKIDQLMRNITHPLVSIPGLGATSAALLIAEIGDINRFNNQAKLAKYAGLTWRKKESGNFRAEETFMTKTGNVFLRRAFLIVAQSLVNHNEEYKVYYQRKFDETPRHAHKRALSLTARKLVRLVYAMLSKNQLYMTPEERMQQGQEVKNSVSRKESVEVLDRRVVTSVDENQAVDKPKTHTVSVDKKQHKKVKATAAARSSLPTTRTQRTQDPPEQYAVNS